MKGDRAAGVELTNLTSAMTYQVAADYVVVAADALRTPQLLFASGVRPAALGRYFNEHPYIAAIFELGTPAPEPGDPELNALMPANGVTWIPFDDDRFPMHAGLHQWTNCSQSGSSCQRRSRGRTGRSSVTRGWTGEGCPACGCITR